MPTINTRSDTARGTAWHLAATGDPARPYEIKAWGWMSATAGADRRMRRRVMAGAGRADPECARALAFLAEWSPVELARMAVHDTGRGWRRVATVLASRVGLTLLALAGVRLLVSLDGSDRGYLVSLSVGVACAVLVAAWASVAKTWIPERRAATGSWTEPAQDLSPRDGTTCHATWPGVGSAATPEVEGRMTR